MHIFLRHLEISQMYLIHAPRDNFSHWVMWSIEKNREDISKMLITAGANTDVQDAQGIYLINNKQL